jgi:2,3-bisphosphoglycerate-independent phosphoglycerate mutase
MFKRTLLIILDGWGCGQVADANAIAKAHTPYFESLMRSYPHGQLLTHGEHVGLPEGQMGNSEVGHLNLGAGRIVYQDLARIHKIIKENKLSENPELQKLAEYCIKNSKPCHLIGLLSDGGVHSHIDHLKAIIRFLEDAGVESIYLHIITDGRDTDPHSGKHFVADIEDFLQDKKTSIASLIGRYYAMDRDKRWERIQLAYDLLIHGKGIRKKSASEAIEDSYNQNITDEFIEAYKIKPVSKGTIQNGDAVLCWNFRTDRLRQLTDVLSQEDSDLPGMKAKSLYYVTLARYDDDFKNVRVVYEKEDIKNTLGEMLSVYGNTQLRIAETEKYPHVSYFFSGGREKIFSGEKRVLIPSPKVATYDLQPEMSAEAITTELLVEMDSHPHDFICLNFANADMVGHTGVFNAVVRAAETLDRCLAKIIPAALEKDYAILILADHGNGEYMINDDGSPNTAHTKNPVPCILVSNQKGLSISDGKLSDIAPSILKLMALPVPVEMDGKCIVHGIKTLSLV